MWIKKGKQNRKNKIDWNGWYRDAPLLLSVPKQTMNAEKVFMIPKPTNEWTKPMCKRTKT